MQLLTAFSPAKSSPQPCEITSWPDAIEIIENATLNPTGSSSTELIAGDSFSLRFVQDRIPTFLGNSGRLGAFAGDGFTL